MSSNDNQVVRAAFEKAYPMPFACGWNSMTHEYECIWPEHGGEDRVEAAIEQHNDRYKVWQTSREAVVVELPEPEPLDVDCDESLEMEPEEYEALEAAHGARWSEHSRLKKAVEAQGLRVAP